MTLGDIMKDYRKSHSMSMDLFAEKSGISKAYISLLEKNKHPKTGKPIAPSIQCIKQAAKGMDMDFNVLFGRIDGNVSLVDDTTEEEQKRIFSKNLNYYMELNGKTQSDLINDLGFDKSAVSTWCNGSRLPRMGKVQRLADYFGIGKTDLIDEKPLDTLTARDNRDIAKDLDRIMEKLQSGESGPASYNGEELDPEAVELFRDELEIALKRLKIINKEKYTNKRYKSR